MPARSRSIPTRPSSDVVEEYSSCDYDFGETRVAAVGSTENEIDLAFESFAQRQVRALFVDTEPFFTDERTKIVTLAAHNRLPAVYQLRESA